MRMRRGCGRTADSLLAPMSAEDKDAEAGPKEGPPAMAQPLRGRRDYGEVASKVAFSGMRGRYEQALSDARDMMEGNEMEPRSALKEAGRNNGIPYGSGMERFVRWAENLLLYRELRASVRQASDAMGLMARQMAEEWVDQNWTTAERGWKEQAKKGMKAVEARWDGAKEEQRFAFETKVSVPQGHYVDDEISTRITVRVSEETL